MYRMGPYLCSWGPNRQDQYVGSAAATFGRMAMATVHASRISLEPSIHMARFSPCQYNMAP